MNSLLIPFVEESKQIKIDQLKNDLNVIKVEEKKDYILFYTKDALKDAKYKFFNPLLNVYRCYDIKALAEKARENAKTIPSPLPEFELDLISSVITMPKELNYLIENKKYSLKIEEAVQIAKERTYRLTDTVLSILYSHSFRDTDEQKKDLIEYFTRMTEHVFYKKHPDFKKEKRIKKLSREYSPEFVKYWIKTQKMSDQQICCDHDDKDQISTDGYFYNSVGECRKCLINMDKDFYSSKCEDSFLVWKAAIKSFKKKKG